MTKLNINLKEGSLEVDGEETFVQSIYDDFKVQLAGIKVPATPNENIKNTIIEQSAAEKQESGSKSKSTRKPAAKRTFTIVKDLDLSGKGTGQSLRDFYAEKNPTNAMECNAVFIYYLQQKASIAGITLDHLYTCYKDVGIKFPNALRQSVADTSSRRGWLDTSSFDDIKISVHGENFVEHDLPRPQAKAE